MSSNPRIQAIETLLVDVPTIRPHRLSVATMNHQTLVLVRVQCSDGIEGWGEATTIGGLAYGEESPESIKANIDTYIAPLLEGQDASAVAKQLARVASQVQGNRFAKCAIETALYDAQALRLGVCLSELFGGRVRDSLPIAWTLVSGDTGRDIAEAERMLDLRRHNIFKLKIGLRPVREDVAHVAAIKATLGARASVRVDANQAWSVTEALDGMRGLADAGVDMVEQPIVAHDKLGLKRLTEANIIPIMADEMPSRGPRRRRRTSSRSRSTSPAACAARPVWPALPRRPTSRCTAARCSKAPSAPWPRRSYSAPSASWPGPPNSSARCC